MQIEINGETYVGGDDACAAFVCELSHLGYWREQGMPYVTAKELGVKAKTGKSDINYMYPLERCRKWHRREAW